MASLEKYSKTLPVNGVLSKLSGKLTLNFCADAPDTKMNKTETERINLFIGDVV